MKVKTVFLCDKLCLKLQKVDKGKVTLFWCLSTFQSRQAIKAVRKNKNKKIKNQNKAV